MMNEFFKLTEVKTSDSPLSEIAKSMKDKTLDLSELDKPIVKEMVKYEKNGLTAEEKTQLKKETGWSDKIVDSIGSPEEADVYTKADLKETEINGKECLIRKDLDMNQKDEFGRTNKERMEDGKPALTKSGETVELHHIGQKADSPLAELTTQEHRGEGNDTILHDKQKESEIDRAKFKNERESHWENRAEQQDKKGDM